MYRVKSATLEIANSGSFDLVHGIWKIVCAKYLHLKCYECISIRLFPCVPLYSKSRICVNSGWKVYFLKRIPIQHFHLCFLVFSYHLSIVQKQNWECILPNHLFAFSNGVTCELYRQCNASLRFALNPIMKLIIICLCW